MELSEFDAWNDTQIAEHDAALNKPVREWIGGVLLACGSVLLIVAGALWMYAHLKGAI